MKEERILDSIKDSINSAPIDILENIKAQDIPKMIKHDDITRQTQSTGFPKTIMPIMSLVAALVLVFGLWQFQYRLPDSHVYLDVNPSVEIVTNKRDKVINILAYNTDGKSIVDGIDYKGRDVVLVTEEIVRNMVDQGYIVSAEDYILLSVYNKNLEKLKSQQQRLNTSIHSYMGKREFVPIVLIQNLEKTSTIESFANEYGISLSKMTFIRNLMILNPELQVEDLVDLSLKELIILSQSMKLDLESIIESDDFERIPEYNPIADDIEDIDDDDDDDDDNDDDEHIDNITERPVRGTISLEEARRIALSLTNGGTIISIELDDDEYEVEIKNDRKTYEIEIDAYNGKVLDFDIDDDDDDEDD